MRGGERLFKFAYWLGVVIAVVFYVNANSEPFGNAPLLRIKYLIADGDTLSLHKTPFEIPWYGRSVRIEFVVLPEDSPDYNIDYRISGKSSYQMSSMRTTEQRFLEFSELVPGSQFNGSVMLLHKRNATRLEQKLDFAFVVQNRPPPALRLEEIIVNNESHGKKTQFELPKGKYSLQFRFLIEPPDYPGCQLYYEFYGPDIQLPERVAENSTLEFDAITPGEYALRAKLKGDFASSNALLVKFQIRKSFLKEHKELAIILGILLYFLINFIFAYLIAKDASKTSREARYWILFALVTSIFGYLIYKIYISSSMIHCPECNELIAANYKFCPFCQTQLKDSCEKCGTEIQTWMHYCVACGAGIAGGKKAGAE
ncbi:zinc ribbon domain-containing protein [candidate division KSB1 bacterium]|nr:zinc ribbon domain-containing protein [candidate division KSB1 bacterium]